MAILAAATVRAQTKVEHGKFRFFDTNQPQGEESYEITNDDNTIVVRSKLELESEKKITLTATLTLKLDLTPLAFEITGTKPSGIETDSSVEIRERAASIREAVVREAVVREGKETNRLALPARFFTIAGYAPMAVEMMLVRYWLRHRLAGPLKIVPNKGTTV